MRVGDKVQILHDVDGYWATTGMAGFITSVGSSKCSVRPLGADSFPESRIGERLSIGPRNQLYVMNKYLKVLVYTQAPISPIFGSRS